MIPGRFLDRLARWLTSPPTYQLCAAQLADFQHEWRRAGNAYERARVLSRGYAAFWLAVVLWTGRAIEREISLMTWSNSAMYPGLVLIIALLILAEAWVTTGVLWSRRFDELDTRLLWACLPLTIAERRFVVLRGARGFPFAVPLLAFSVAAIYAMDFLQPLLTGWEPALMVVAVGTLLQRKEGVSPTRRSTSFFSFHFSLFIFFVI